MAPFVKRAVDLFGSRVTLVNVCDLESHNGFELYVRTLADVADEHRKLAQEQLEGFLTSEFPSDCCSRMLRSGDPASEITETARTRGYDLIVMPTHAGRFRRMLLGSTTAKVLNDADCPVLTAEHAENKVIRPLEHRAWMCGIDLNEDSQRLLCVASRAAAAAGAQLTLIHVTQHGDDENARRRLEELQQVVGSEAPFYIGSGPVKEVLLHAASQCEADVLIVGRGAREPDRGRLRDLVYTLVRDSPCPVLSV